MSLRKIVGKIQDFTKASMNHDIQDFTLSTLHVSRRLSGHGVGNGCIKVYKLQNIMYHVPVKE